MSEASRNWPDMGQVVEDNLQQLEDERIREARDREARNEPEEGADSDEDRVERARKRHEELGAQDEGGVNSEPLAEAVPTPGADVEEAPAQDERAAAEDKPGGGEYSKSMGDEEPIPVAEQKAAGVPPEETVTIAEQKAGTPPPDLAGPAE